MIIHVNKIIKAKSFEKLRNIEIVTRIEHKMMKFNKCHDVKEATYHRNDLREATLTSIEPKILILVFYIISVQFSNIGSKQLVVIEFLSRTPYI